MSLKPVVAPAAAMAFAPSEATAAASNKIMTDLQRIGQEAKAYARANGFDDVTRANYQHAVALDAISQVRNQITDIDTLKNMYQTVVGYEDQASSGFWQGLADVGNSLGAGWEQGVAQVQSFFNPEWGNDNRADAAEHKAALSGAAQADSARAANAFNFNNMIGDNQWNMTAQLKERPLDFIAETLGNVGPSAAGALAGTVATATGVGAAVGVPLVAASLGVGAMQSGGSVRDDIYTTAMSMTPQELQHNSPLYNELIKSGMTPDQAKLEVATSLRDNWGEFIGSTALGAASNFIPGGQAAKSFVGKALGQLGYSPTRTAASNIAREGAVGAATEAWQQALSNSAVQDTVDQRRQISEGVAESAVLGGALEGGIAGIGSAIKSAGTTSPDAQTTNSAVDQALSTPRMPVPEQPTRQSTPYNEEQLKSATSRVPAEKRARFMQDFITDAKYGILDTESNNEYSIFVRDALGMGAQPKPGDAVAQPGETVPTNLESPIFTRIGDDDIMAANTDSLYEPGDQAAVEQTQPEINNQAAKLVTKRVARGKPTNDNFVDVNDQAAAAESKAPRSSTLDRARIKHIRGSKKFVVANDSEYDGINNIVIEPETAEQPVETIEASPVAETQAPSAEPAKVSLIDNNRVMELANTNLNAMTPAELETRARKELNGNEYRLLVNILKSRAREDYDAEGNYIGGENTIEGNLAKRERKPEKKYSWVAKQLQRFASDTAAATQTEPQTEVAETPPQTEVAETPPQTEVAETPPQAEVVETPPASEPTPEPTPEPARVQSSVGELSTVSKRLTDAGAKHTEAAFNNDFDSNYWKIRDHGFSTVENLYNTLSDNLDAAVEDGVPSVFENQDVGFGSNVAAWRQALGTMDPVSDELVVLATTAPIGAKKFSSEPMMPNPKTGQLDVSGRAPIFSTDVAAMQQRAKLIDGNVYGSYVRAESVYPWTGNKLSREQELQLAEWAGAQGYDGVMTTDGVNMNYIPSKVGTTMGTQLTVAKGSGRLQKDRFYSVEQKPLYHRTLLGKIAGVFTTPYYNKRISDVESIIDDVIAGNKTLNDIPSIGSYTFTLGSDAQARWNNIYRKLYEHVLSNTDIPDNVKAKIRMIAPQQGDVHRGGYYNNADGSITVHSLTSDISRVASVIVHELGHRQSATLRNVVGVDNYIHLIERLRTNDFIRGLEQSSISRDGYQTMSKDNAYYLQNPYLVTEEIIVDMAAASKNNDWAGFAKRYGINESDIPSEFKQRNGLVRRVYDAMVHAFKVAFDIMNGNKPVTNDQVRNYVDSLGSINSESIMSLGDGVLTELAKMNGYDNKTEFIVKNKLGRTQDQIKFFMASAGLEIPDFEIPQAYKDKVAKNSEAYEKKFGKPLEETEGRQMMYSSNNQDVLDFSRTGKSVDPGEGIFGSGEKTWGGLVKRWARAVEERISDDLVPVKTFLEGLNLSKTSEQRIIGDLYLADGRRASKASEFENLYMKPFFGKINAIAKKHGMDYKDAKRLVGFWMSARYALIKNQEFIDQDIAAIQEAQKVYNQTPTNNNYDKLREARLKLAKRQADIYNPDPEATDFEIGVAGGYNNVKAETVMRNLEKLVPLQEIEDAAQHIYDLQAARLEIDLQSGRIGQQAYLEYKQNPYYVPLTGDPRADNDIDDVINTGGQSVNQRGQKQAKGRKSSMAEDGVDATWKSVARSLGYYGYSDFKNGIRGIYNAVYQKHLNKGLSESEAHEATKEEIGIERSPVTMQRTNDPVLIISENDKQYAYKLPRKAMDAIQHNNREDVNTILKMAEVPTRAFARAVTQFYPAFAPINFARDAWERSTVLRSRTVYDQQGNKVDMDKVSNAMLKRMTDPRAFRDSIFWTDPDGKTQRSRNLQDLIRYGGLSTHGTFLARTEKDLVKRIEREGRIDKKVIDGTVQFVEAYNRAFDLLPPLAAYESLLEAGVAPKDAAAATLDTMNFRKQGRWMRPIKALYMFAQPTATGFVNLAKQLSTKKGAIQAAAYYATMLGLYELIRMSGDDEEAGNTVDTMGDITRFIPIPNPADPGKYFKFPVGFGLPQLMWNMATNTSRAYHGDITWDSAATNMAAHMSKVMIPVSPSDIPADEHLGAKVAMTATPTILQPFMQLVLDRTPFGSKLTPQYVDKGKLKAEQSKSTTAPEWKDAAIAIQRITGIDMHAEEVKALWDGYSGMLGPLRDITKVAIENPNRERLGKEKFVPVFNSLYGPGNEYSTQQRYYEAFDKAQAIKNEYDSRKERRDLGKWMTPEIRRQLNWFERADTELRKINQRKAKITKAYNKGHQSDEVYRRRVDEIAKQTERAQAKYLHEWRKMEGLNTKRGNQ